MDTATCQVCAAATVPGQRFCTECGLSLSAACSSCGAAVDPGHRFCGVCGTPTGVAAIPPAPELAAQPVLDRVTERRQCSVLFADIVGFTPLAEARDHEQVRELLSGYFDVARTVITRHGGRVEKFVGDAVMAVWGTPLAREDDAELAVRAGLELVSAVTGYGLSIHVPDLRVRAGIVTGEVSVTLGAQAEGMVAGDAVNTAARIQSAASPGTVLTDETSYHLTRSAIGFAPAGSHTLKGKAEPAPLYQAVRAVAGAGGQERVDVLEAAFIGRDPELRLLKDQFHASADRRTARLIVLAGEAGIGKTRLRWEFDKYVDGLPSSVLWHSGKCLSYGDGVAFWALAEMVRQRFGIGDTDPTDVAEVKLGQMLARWLPDPEDRDVIGPRLRVLLGLSQESFLREELFVGWRLFLQRLADQDPVVLVVEDGHQADPGLLDFFDHLLDWAAASPIFILFLTRPELAERRPGWGAGRHAMTLRLEALAEPEMATLLNDLVDDLPVKAREQIIGRAAGVPLYAVETIRSLIDLDIVRPVDGRYRVTGDVGVLDTPPSLVALLAARIDALPETERSLVRDLSVLGTSFPRSAIAAVRDQPAGQLDDLLHSLTRREILRVQADRLSPQQGEYAFTQELLRSVAYQTLARRDRKSRHLAVAAHLQTAFANDGEEIAEIIAAHLHDAYQAGIDDPDADELRRQAVTAFRRAGQRALSVGAPETAAAQLKSAVELASDEQERAELLGSAGRAALLAGRHEHAIELLDHAIALHEQAGRTRDVALLTAPLSAAANRTGRSNFAITRLRHAISVLHEDDCPESAELEAALGKVLFYAGIEVDAADSILQSALDKAQALELPEVLASALDLMGQLRFQQRRPAEGFALLDKAVAVARQSSNPNELAHRHINAGYLRLVSDEPGVREHLEAALELAQQIGSRGTEAVAIENLMGMQILFGEWAQAQTRASDFIDDESRPDREYIFYRLAFIAALQNRRSALTDYLLALEEWRSSEQPESRANVLCLDAYLFLADGKPVEALAAADEAISSALQVLDLRGEFRDFYAVALEAALAIPSPPDITRLLDLVGNRPPGHVPPYLRAQHARFTARRAAAEGEHEQAAASFDTAEQIFTKLGYPYWLALTQLEHAEHHVGLGQHEPARLLAASAGAQFERLDVPSLASRARQIADVPLPADTSESRSAVSAS